MQTFLPLPDFQATAEVLDWRRLGKQRVEATQILKSLTDPLYGWQNHPAVNMWRGYEDALVLYRNTVIRHWIDRGYQNNMPIMEHQPNPTMPHWLGHSGFHAAHRSNLLRKAPDWYEQFGWSELDNLPYLWPT